MKKQPELTALTRKKLIDAYFELAAGGERASVGSVAEAAGFNRCTFYRYFTDIDQLLFQVETEICDSFEDALRHHGSAVASPDIIGAFADVHRKYGTYLSVLLGRYGSARFMGRMQAMMKPAASQLFKTASDSSDAAELKVEFMLSAVLATIMKWIDMDRPFPAEELGELIKELLLHGVFSGKAM